MGTGEDGKGKMKRTKRRGRELKGKERRRRVGSEDKDLGRKGRRIEGKGKE